MVQHVTKDHVLPLVIHSQSNDHATENAAKQTSIDSQMVGDVGLQKIMSNLFL